MLPEKFAAKELAAEEGADHDRKADKLPSQTRKDPAGDARVVPRMLVREPAMLVRLVQGNALLQVFERRVLTYNPANWTGSYGGFDNPDPSSRRNYIPVSFIPHQNPFYFALPYNDVTHGQFKPEAPLVIPWFKQAYTGQGQSVCRHRWIAIRKGNSTCYAQWEDCGPFRTDHFQYVFQNERPKPNLNHGAGLDVSPAVRDYLGLAPTDVTDWQFVEVRDVPPGPWRNYGENNHFVIARRQTEQRMAERLSGGRLLISPDDSVLIRIGGDNRVGAT